MAPAKNGPNLWSNLTIEEIREYIRFSHDELRRVYAIKAQQEATHCFVNNAVLKEIAFWEAAHDNHFDWLKAKTGVTRGSEIAG
jgi:hypothetical protein